MRHTLGVAVFSGMLGVTLFGLFLTPVFFFTIDWLGGTPVFASWAMRLAGRWSLNVVSLRPVREYAHRMLVARSKKKATVPKSSADTVTRRTTTVVEVGSNGHDIKSVSLPTSERLSAYKD